MKQKGAYKQKSVLKQKPQALIRSDKLKQPRSKVVKTPSFLILPHEPLSEREVEILGLVAADLNDQEVAQYLQISPRTVGNHLHKIFAKLGVRGRGGAVALALVKGLINPQKLDFSMNSNYTKDFE